MTNLLDYIAWRKDIPCSMAPFNDADYYLLSKIGTLDFSDIVPTNKCNVSYECAVNEYLNTGRKLGQLSSPNIIDGIKATTTARRYSDIKLSAFRMKCSEQNTEQFSALTLKLPDNTLMVTFRGTDDTIVGWKEDLQMAVKNTVPSQLDAVNYLKYIAATHFGPIIVAGHSKGGNLAVFAASNVAAFVQKRIKAIYNFDGPGFHSSFYLDTNYNNIKDKLHEVIPSTSIIGIMLEKECPLHIVKAQKSGIASHDGFLWEADSDGFVVADDLDNASKNLQTAVKDVLENMTQEEVSLFIDQLFTALEVGGAKTITDIFQQKNTTTFINFKKNPRKQTN